MYTREVKETSSKPPKQLTAKDTLDVIEAIIEKYENLQDGLSKRTNLDAKESRVPGMTKREGWIAFKVNGELQNPRDAASCFTQMLKRRVGTAVEVKGDNFHGPLEVLYPGQSDVQ